MSNNNKRYVVSIDMYVYAENDYKAKEIAERHRLSINNKLNTNHVNVTEIGEQPFASTYYRKLDNPMFISKEEASEPFPF